MYAHVCFAHPGYPTNGGSGSPDGFFIKFVGSENTLTVTPTQPDKYLHWIDGDIRVEGKQVKVPDASGPPPLARPPDRLPTSRPWRGTSKTAIRASLREASLR